MARDAYKPQQKINTRSQSQAQPIAAKLKTKIAKKNDSPVAEKVKNKAAQKIKSSKKSSRQANKKSKSEEEEKKALQFLFGSEELSDDVEEVQSQDESCDESDCKKQSQKDSQLQPGDEEKEQSIKDFFENFKKLREQNGTKIACPQKINDCKFKTNSIRMLKEHLRSEHTILLLRLGIYEAACQYCKKGFTREGDCLRHEETLCPLRPLKKVQSIKSKKINQQFIDLNCKIEE